MRKFIFIIQCIFAFLYLSSILAIGQILSSYEIPLNSGILIMGRGEFDTGDSRYVIAQFDKAPKKEEIEELKDLGINLLSFLYKKAWICAVDPSFFLRGK